MSIYGFKPGKSSYDKDAFAAEKKKQREEVYALIDKTMEEMMTDRELFLRYLRAQGQFDRYSVNNAVLLAAQMPTAKLLKCQKDWKALGITLRKDARKTLLLEPKPYTKGDGSQGIVYNIKEVYDISQTSEAAGAAFEEPQPVRTIVRALIEASPVPVRAAEELERDAYYDRERREILARKGLPSEQLIPALAREACCAVYDIKRGEDVSKTMKPVCAAYMVCVGCGVNSERLAALMEPQTLGAEDIDEFKKILYGMRESNREMQANMYKVLHRGSPEQSSPKYEEER